jgi:hypothetical protein
MTALPTPLQPAHHKIDGVGIAATATIAIAGAAIAVASDGNLAIAVAPLLAGVLLVMLCTIPLRDTLLALAFLALTLENPSEIPAAGLWRSPLYKFGALFLMKLNDSIPVKALVFSGMDIALVFAIGLWVARRMSGSAIDLRGRVPTAAPMRQAAIICIVGIFCVLAFGLVRGGNFGSAIWQVQRVIYLPTIVLLYSAALRGPPDRRAIAITLIAAALVRATLAIYIRHLFPNYENPSYATVHADSMLFADAFLLVLVIFFERPTPKSLLLLTTTLPLLSWGMIANHRRLVWVELALGLIVLFAVMRRKRIKRAVTRILVLSVPLMICYLAIGWSNPTGVFRSVATIRSVIDSSSDPSTWWRDAENFNLVYTLKQSPLLGTGYGHGYIEAIHLPDVSTAYALYRQLPHNAILGLVTFCGFFGFAAIWMPLPLGVFFSIRSYRFARTAGDRITALGCLGVLVTYAVHCYGDMGLGTWTSVFTVGPALALVAKQAIATGAWPAPLAARRPSRYRWSLPKPVGARVVPADSVEP